MAGLDLAIHAAGAGRGQNRGQNSLGFPAGTAIGVDDLIKSSHGSGQEAPTPGSMVAKMAAARDERGATVKPSCREGLRLDLIWPSTPPARAG